MTDNTPSLAQIARLLETAQNSIKQAYQLLANIDPTMDFSKQSGSDFSADLSQTQAYSDGGNQVVEGVFDGQKMIGPEDKTFPVPPNYASKSKLIEGDRLKLTIKSNGTFLYKQISPADRKFVKGTLLKEDGHFIVNAKNKNYRVILASVTYYKGQAGDEVTLIIPKDKESNWAAIEAIIPQVGKQNYQEDLAF
jgi:hypothetical protein